MQQHRKSGCRAGRSLAFGLAVLAVLALPLGRASAQRLEETRFAVMGARAELPEVEVLLDAAAADGSPLAVAGEDLRASLADRTLTLERLVPFAETGDGIAYALLVDVSRELPDGAFDRVKAQLRSWIEGLREVDRAAVLAVGAEARVVQAFTADRALLTAALDGLTIEPAPARLFDGVALALDAVEADRESLPARRLAVLLADGRDSESAIDEVALGDRLSEAGVPFYSIGYSLVPGAQREELLDVLRRIAERSGGLFFEASRDPEAAYARVQQAIQRTLVARFSCEPCAASDTPQTLEISLSVAAPEATAPGADAAADAPRPEHRTLVARASVQVSDDRLIARIGAGAARLALAGTGLLVLLLALFAGLRVRRRRRAAAASPDATGEAAPVALAEQPQPASASDPGIAAVDADTAPAVFPQDDPAGVVETPTRGGPARGAVLPLRFEVLAGGPLSTARIDVVDRVVLGRRPDCDVVVEDDEVSKRHLAFDMRHGKLLVEDLESSNGTLLNGIPLRGRAVVASGDRILVGKTEFRLETSA